METEKKEGMLRGLSVLLRDLREDTSTLLRQELALAKTEVAEKVDGVKRHSVYVLAGAGFLYLGLFFGSLVVGVLAYFGMVRTGALSPATAFLASFGGLSLLLSALGVGMLIKGLARLRGNRARLSKTLQSLEETREWVKHKVG